MSTDDLYSSYPLRQALLPGAADLPLFAQRGRVDWLSRPERYLVVCEGRGGRIYAATENALGEARQVLADAYGKQLVLRPPEIHTFEDEALGGLAEPVMFLRLRSPRACAAALLKELARRQATLIEHDAQRDVLLLRAEARLADVMGITETVSRLTNGSAALWIWLTRYELARPVPEPAR